MAEYFKQNSIGPVYNVLQEENDRVLYTLNINFILLFFGETKYIPCLIAGLITTETFFPEWIPFPEKETSRESFLNIIVIQENL